MDYIIKVLNQDMPWWVFLFFLVVAFLIILITVVGVKTVIRDNKNEPSNLQILEGVKGLKGRNRNGRTKTIKF